MAPNSRSAARRYAEKSRRRRPSRPTRVIEPPSVQDEDASSAPASAPAPAEPTSSPVIQHRIGETRVTIAPRFRGAAAIRPSTFESTDYGYVMGDLRRVMIVAGSLVAGLVVLSFVIH